MERMVQHEVGAGGAQRGLKDSKRTITLELIAENETVMPRIRSTWLEISIRSLCSATTHVYEWIQEQLEIDGKEANCRYSYVMEYRLRLNDTHEVISRFIRDEATLIEAVTSAIWHKLCLLTVTVDVMEPIQVEASTDLSNEPISCDRRSVGYHDDEDERVSIRSQGSSDAVHDTRLSDGEGLRTPESETLQSPTSPPAVDDDQSEHQSGEGGDTAAAEEVVESPTSPSTSSDIRTRDDGGENGAARETSQVPDSPTSMRDRATLPDRGLKRPAPEDDENRSPSKRFRVQPPWRRIGDETDQPAESENRDEMYGNRTVEQERPDGSNDDDGADGEDGDGELADASDEDGREAGLESEKLLDEHLARRFDIFDRSTWDGCKSLFQVIRVDGAGERGPDGGRRADAWIGKARFLNGAKPYGYQCYAAYIMIRNMAGEGEGRRASTILGDEMGLGKTRTCAVAIAGISHLIGTYLPHESCTAEACSRASSLKQSSAGKCPRSSSEVEGNVDAPYCTWRFERLPTLIVCPIGAMGTWRAEIARTLGNFVLVDMALPSQARKAKTIDFLRYETSQVEDESEAKGGNLWKMIVLVSLTTFQKAGGLITRLVPAASVASRSGNVAGKSKAQPFIPARSAFLPSIIIFDESHSVSNLETNTAKFLKRLMELRSGKTVLWSVTGTPLPGGPRSMELTMMLWDCAEAEQINWYANPKTSKQPRATNMITFRSMERAKRGRRCAAMHKLSLRFAEMFRTTPVEADDQGISSSSSATIKDIVSGIEGLIDGQMIRRDSDSLFLGEKLMDLPPQTHRDELLKLDDKLERQLLAAKEKIRTGLLNRAKTDADVRHEGPNIVAAWRLHRLYISLPNLMNVRGGWNEREWTVLEEARPRRASGTSGPRAAEQEALPQGEHQARFVEWCAQRDGGCRTMTDSDSWRSPYAAEIDRTISSSPKLRRLIEMCEARGFVGTSPAAPANVDIRDVVAGPVAEKMIVFTNSPAETYNVQLALHRRNIAAVAVFANVPTSGPERGQRRQELIDNTFQGISDAGRSEAHVLIGPFGLLGQSYTITVAKTVVAFGPSFLLDTEKQARGRVQRVGQRRATESIRFVAKGLFDETLVEKQKKRADFDKTLIGIDSKGGQRSNEGIIIDSDSEESV